FAARAFFACASFPLYTSTFDFLGLGCRGTVSRATEDNFDLDQTIEAEAAANMQKPSVMTARHLARRCASRERPCLAARYQRGSGWLQGRNARDGHQEAHRYVVDDWEQHAHRCLRLQHDQSPLLQACAP